MKRIEASADDQDVDEWRALVALCIQGFIASLWALWFLSLYFSGALLWVFIADVSAREGLILGVVHATWVAGVPVTLLLLGHVVNNGWKRPDWGLRWLLVVACTVIWCLVLAWWLDATPSYESY